MFSDEQRAIIEAVSGGRSVIVNAVAGSGKTTTVLGIAEARPDRRFVQITYNRQLKFEVRQKVQSRGITNLEIHTYHSLAVAHYGREAYDDVGMSKALRDGPHYIGDDVDVVIIDETQDMTPLYYRLARRFVRECGAATLVLLGDEYQSIYDFKNADRRFLTMAERLWPEFEFEQLPLGVSYRLTRPIASYVNEVMIGHDRIRATRDGVKVIHVQGNIFDPSALVSYIKEGLDAREFRPDDIFVLASSVRNPRAPIRHLEHELVALGVPCYTPLSDDKDFSADLIRGKVVFTTFHQAKGRERNLVIVYGLDDGYIRFGHADGGGVDRTVCPSTFYVAATRAKKALIALEGSVIGLDTTAPFVKIPFDALGECDYVHRVYTPPSRPGPARQDRPQAVTQMARFLDAAMTETLSKMIDDIFYVVCPASAEPRVIKGSAEGLYGPEEVQDINGQLMPLMYQQCVQKGVWDGIELELRSKPHSYFERYYDEAIMAPRGSIERHLRMILLRTSISEGLYFRLAQIKKYDWLTEDDIDYCVGVMAQHLPIDARFEVGHETSTMSGRADVLSDTQLWELKCVSALTLEHKIQLACYATMWPGRQYRLLNICSGEVLAIRDGCEDHLFDIVNLLVTRSSTARADDSEFISRNL